VKLIETDAFSFEFLSRIGERESWRKEVHRPIYHVHKWWAKRLGSVFRGILLGCTLGPNEDLEQEFYRTHEFSGFTVLDPFMGSGTTVGEAHKLGFTAFGRDINPVAVNAVRVALGPLDRRRIQEAFEDLSLTTGEQIRALYRSWDAMNRPCEVLYHFWVMQTDCPACGKTVELFPSYVFAKNAYPSRKPQVQIVCPSCGDIFPGLHGKTPVSCPSCDHSFSPESGPARGLKARCPHCTHSFRIIDAVGRKRPPFRHYAKLVLTRDGRKQYLAPSEVDDSIYVHCTTTLRELVQSRGIVLPELSLQHGHNTRQAMSYGFLAWRDFFNDRQLLALSILRSAIANLSDEMSRNAFLTLFSGVLEFNNLFASYKGEGTGAVRHMFSHHILKPERRPIEANVWGTPKSSGSFSSLYRTRLLRAIDYRENPSEVNRAGGARGVVCSPPFVGDLQRWGVELPPRAIALSCGDSAVTGLPDCSIDLVVTDPPFFDNVHYSELADFFFAWQQLGTTEIAKTTRSEGEVQDANVEEFAAKLRSVYQECHRVLKNDGIFVFTYHHSRDEAWKALADAILGSGFLVVNSHPVKAEMSVATPKSQAKEPIQLDIVIVCRKSDTAHERKTITPKEAILSGRTKLKRLHQAGFKLSRNDGRIVIFGQLLTTLRSPDHMQQIIEYVDRETANPLDFDSIPDYEPPRAVKRPPPAREVQRALFD